ncbi:respiratory nitrate reductase subunit gamma [Niallia endozanthoxylica]|uniref:Respiratory nitrate reductase subunit gamma n=1 Tax=Niallia endozanthoxylica TaxID=2036016 RepID=A0A5J5HZM7_9BACI|nr:respiratory nitrate reductase subunit gamma [Niallia endozanthoxylica]KAA9027535.1 respiratory nitrate reductase subunit gamma [Niallia endozanthoxylica]
MEIFNMILWVIYPYTVLIIVMMGRLWKCDFSQLYKGNKIFESIGTVLFIVVKALLWLSLLSGAASLFVSGVGNDLLDMLYWGISFISFRPNTDLIEKMSLLTQLHMMVLFTFFLVLSFTMFFSKSDKNKKTLKIVFKENKSQKLI